MPYQTTYLSNSSSKWHWKVHILVNQQETNEPVKAHRTASLLLSLLLFHCHLVNEQTRTHKDFMNDKQVTFAIYNLWMQIQLPLPSVSSGWETSIAVWRSAVPTVWLQSTRIPTVLSKPHCCVPEVHQIYLRGLRGFIKHQLQQVCQLFPWYNSELTHSHYRITTASSGMRADSRHRTVAPHSTMQLCRCVLLSRVTANHTYLVICLTDMLLPLTSQIIYRGDQ